MKNLKQLTALLLCGAMLTSALAGCSDAPAAEAETPADGLSANGETLEETEEVFRYSADIPEDVDYGGAAFTMLAYPNDGTIWTDVDWSAEEITGEVLNDAVYGRTMYVSDLLNVAVTTAYMASYGNNATLEKSVTSGEDAYQLANATMRSSFSLLQSKRIHELNAFAQNGTLQLRAPWWDPNILDDLSILGKNFCLTGDIGTMYKKSIGVIMFNKEIRSQNNLSDPYELMRNGQWTVDQMVAMGSKISVDLNGDGKMTDEDQFGLICFRDMIALAMIGCGVDYFTKDENGTPVDSFLCERSVSVLEKLATLLYDPNLTYSWSKAGVGEDVAFRMYQSDKALFYYGELHSVVTMREMESPFGILPMPMYDETQESYRHCVNPNVAAVFVIPMSNVKYEMTGYVMDALGAESKNQLTPAYYDKTLRGKVTRDEESQASLDIIINSIKYDLGYVGDFGIGSMLYSMADSCNSDLTSRYAKLAKTTTKNIERMMSKIAALDK